MYWWHWVIFSSCPALAIGIGLCQLIVVGMVGLWTIAIGVFLAAIFFKSPTPGTYTLTETTLLIHQGFDKSQIPLTSIKQAIISNITHGKSEAIFSRQIRLTLNTTKRRKTLRITPLNQHEFIKDLLARKALLDPTETKR